MLPKTSSYVKKYDGEIKWTYFFIEDDELLGTSNSIWKRDSNSSKKDLDCESIYNKKILKTKTMSCGDEARDFHDKEVP